MDNKTDVPKQNNDSGLLAKITAFISQYKAPIFIALIIIIVLVVLSRFIALNTRSTRDIHEQVVQLSQQADQLVNKYQMQQQIIADQQQQIVALQKANDALRKGAVKNAYTKAHSVPDSEFISAFNELINAARKRNDERRLAISNDIKN